MKTTHFKIKNIASLLLITFSIFNFQFSTAQEYALDFDGNDYVETTNFSLNETFSIEFWIKMNNLTDNQNFIGKFHTGIGSHANLFLIGNWGVNSLQVGIRGSAYTILNVQKVNTWQHIAVVGKKVSSSKTDIAIYVNGVLVSSPSASIASSLGNTSSSYGWIMGLDIDSNNSKDQYLKGQMDEVRFWNRAISQTEIRNNMNKRLTGNETDLVSYYPMNGGSGLALKDASENGNNGTLKK